MVLRLPQRCAAPDGRLPRRCADPLQGLPVKCPACDWCAHGTPSYWSVTFTAVDEYCCSPMDAGSGEAEVVVGTVNRQFLLSIHPTNPCLWKYEVPAAEVKLRHRLWSGPNCDGTMTQQQYSSPTIQIQVAPNELRLWGAGFFFAIDYVAPVDCNASHEIDNHRPGGVCYIQEDFAMLGGGRVVAVPVFYEE